MTAAPDNPQLLRSVRQRPRLSALRTVVALILREMSATYGKSPGGYVWAVLEPLLGIALLSAIFSIGFRSPRLGNNFPIYYATGILPFLMFMDASNKMSQAVNYSKALLAYPRVTFVDTLIARFTLSALTQLLVGCLILTGIRLTWDTRTTLEIDRVLLAYSMAAALAIGVGTMNCFLMTMFPLWQRAWSIMTRPLFLVSGVIFLYDTIPEPYKSVVWYNPLMHVTGEMRGAFFLSYEAEYVSPLFVFGVSLGLAVTGMIFLRRYHRDMMEI